MMLKIWRNHITTLKYICRKSANTKTNNTMIFPLFFILLLPWQLTIYGMQIRQPWTTKHWCDSVINPEWPFAYSKFANHTEEKKGRVSTNQQDVRHKCNTLGVQSKCHRCEDIACGVVDPSTGKRKQKCHFQLQGVDWSVMSKNIPTVSDIPWAVGGSHRYDFGGENTSHVCMYMSSTPPCQSNFGTDYSNCTLRCWGYINGLSGRNITAGPNSSLNGTITGVWPYVNRNMNYNNHGVNTTPWTLPEPTASWNYPKTDSKSLPINPNKEGGYHISMLPQGFTFTLAGSSNGQSGFLDGIGNDARFNHPEGVAVDDEGYVYVCDTGNNAIRMISPSGNVTTLAGRSGNPGFQDDVDDNDSFQNAEFSSPSGIALWNEWHDDQDKDEIILFVADTGNHRVRRIIAGGKYYDEVSGEKLFKSIKVDCFAGYCSSTATGDIRPPQAGFSDGDKYTSRFDSPRGLAVNQMGTVFVTDTNNHLIRAIDSGGITKTIAGTLTIAEINEQGEPFEGCPSPCLKGIAGYLDGPTMKSKFSYPTDIAIHTDGTSLVITDNHYLRRIDLVQNLVTTLVGDHIEGESDGQGGEVRFNKPHGVAVTSDGFTYIADSASCRIRRVSLTSLIVSKAQCFDNISHLMRPSGCTSYNSAIDNHGMKTTAMSGNIHYNVLSRELSHNELGIEYIGRGLKNCVGSPPTSHLEKRLWNEGTLVIDNHVIAVREDPNDGSRIQVLCDQVCSDTHVIRGLRKTLPDNSSLSFYTEHSSVCIAAVHAKVSSNEEGALVSVILHQEEDIQEFEAFEYSIISGDMPINISDVNVGQLFSISKLNYSSYSVQTISGAPSTLLQNSCGYKDSIPPQEAKFGTPTGIAAFVSGGIDDANHFLYVADRNNNVIRGLSAVCSFPCENGGRCVAPDICSCNHGWSGIDCSIPICSSPCGDRSVCVAPETCDCIPGYKGDSCNIATCVQDCKNGGSCSAPDTCSCEPGWFDANCTTPVCEQTCGNGGNCTAPNLCDCPSDWTGHDCRSPVCEQECLNGGICVAPNTCYCTPDWSGFDCAEPICRQGFFEPYDKSITERPLHWSEYRPCNLIEWCKDTNSFHCKQEKCIMSKTVPLHGEEWRHKTGRITVGDTCLNMEIRPDALTGYSYLSSWTNHSSPHRRYSLTSPYDWISEKRQPWNARVDVEDGFTSPWTFEIDRQIGLVSLYNITQGSYHCANGGICVAPDTCTCPLGWIGFDCRVPVCSQGFHESNQDQFVKGNMGEEELHVFKPFLDKNKTYWLDPSDDSYSNPPYYRIVEKFINASFMERSELTTGDKPYYRTDGALQGGYSCSIRSVTQWEDYRSGFLFEHPNYYSRYMDSKVEEDGNVYTNWDHMGWKPTYYKTGHLELTGKSLGILETINRTFLYTDQGYRRKGSWFRTNSPWMKGSCIIEFKRICDDGRQVHDLQAEFIDGINYLVQDTDLSFRPRVYYDDMKEYSEGEWSTHYGDCIDHVIRGCFNNGTCVAPNTCVCAPGWKGDDCSIPICSQRCRNHGNCTLPNTCTCERGWTGHDCSTPLCAQECNNGGTCVAPDTCECLQWENSWRDGRIEGGVPLFQTADGDAQLTGWTGYDCSTPICVQAETFLLNIDWGKKDWSKLILLGGHGKDGKLECFEDACPAYDEMVTTNDGRSFQTGCGFDPLITGCCFNFQNETYSYAFKCVICKQENLVFDSHAAICPDQNIIIHYYSSEAEIPKIFKHSGNRLKICGSWHNPDYYIYDKPGGLPEFSSHNYQSSSTSDYFLCKRHQWEQGEFINDAHISSITLDESNHSYIKGRHLRVNYIKYDRDPINPYLWRDGDSSPGEGIFACYNKGSCIAPDICSCRDGYTGFDCRTPICRHRQVDGNVVGCLNGGLCQDKDKCSCIQTVSILWMKHKFTERGMTGWTGSDCSMPICTQGYYEPICDDEHSPGGEGCYRCPNDGLCIGPDVCKCSKGWTGFDCKTPVCEAVATPLIKNQLMTLDQEKIKIFETDPCGMKGFYEPESVDGVDYYRGNCTLPNKCTCFCKSSYNIKLCALLGGAFCKKPFQDPLRKYRNVLAPNQLFGTRYCNSGYEGIVDDKDNFISCHMTIYEPNYFVKNTVSVVFWSVLTLLTCIISFIISGRRRARKQLLAKIEQRRVKRESYRIPPRHVFLSNNDVMDSKDD